MMGKKGFEQKRKEVEEHRRESFFSEGLRTRAAMTNKSSYL
jgi:hypothetical protein